MSDRHRPKGTSLPVTQRAPLVPCAALCQKQRRQPSKTCFSWRTLCETLWDDHPPLAWKYTYLIVGGLAGYVISLYQLPVSPWLRLDCLCTVVNSILHTYLVYSPMAQHEVFLREVSITHFRHPKSQTQKQFFLHFEREPHILQNNW